MNQQDRDYLARLYRLTADWPWWNRASTTTPRVLARFAEHMEAIQDEELGELESLIGTCRSEMDEEG